MASLYKRATPFQERLLRAVEGAVHNAAHAHPEFLITDKFARSIAKRAAGTISAQMPGSLAGVTNRSGSATRSSKQPVQRTASHLLKAPSGSTHSASRAKGGVTSVVKRHSLIPELVKQLSIKTGEARRAKRFERVDSLVEVLILIDKLTQGPLPPCPDSEPLRSNRDDQSLHS
jgi:hypothetical protein